MTNEPAILKQLAASIPWEQVFSWVFGTLVPILIGVIKIYADKLAKSNKTITAVLDGVEQAKPGSSVKQVKQSIQAEAIKAGVEEHLAPMVNKATSVADSVASARARPLP